MDNGGGSEKENRKENSRLEPAAMLAWIKEKGQGIGQKVEVTSSWQENAKEREYENRHKFEIEIVGGTEHRRPVIQDEGDRPDKWGFESREEELIIPERVPLKRNDFEIAVEEMLGKKRRK